MSNNTDILQRGDKIGCYRIEDILGRGGFAVTYLATDENLDVEVAIKEYLPREITQRDDNLHVSARKPEFAEDYDTGLENFAREAKTLARFKHPHIVRVHQVLHANNTAYMVMDFEHGQELGEIMEQQQTLSEDELRGILFPILDGVEEIHRHGFVHRDIKPSNIYVRHNGSPVLIDFGAARYTMSETTQQLTAVVTVGYTPIEQYNVSEDAQGPWSDIYALAAVCYEAVTGDVPADSVTRASASVTQGDDPLPSVRSQIKNDYSDDCLDAIDWGLRMEAEDRPQVIAQWRDSFDGIFNPASAYVAQKDVSIYSPHRVDKPRQSSAGSAEQSSRSNEDVVSIPLQTTETPYDTGVVSLEQDAVVTTMPPPVPHSASGRDNTPSHIQSRSHSHSERNVTEHPSARISANDSTPRDTRRTDHTVSSQPETPQQPPQQQSPKRSKLERPSHLADAPPKRRTIREDIEFDDSDWDYVPPKKNSALKLLFPVIGLAAVVIGSLTLVNFPQLIPGFGNNDPDLTPEQSLDIAQIKFNTESYIFPEGDSALDYYQLTLKNDPNNPEAQAGIQSIEAAVKEQIASNMERNNLSEANRILERADDAGLSGLNNTTDVTSTTLTTPAVETSSTTIAETSPVVTPLESTTITPINTAPLQPTSTTAESRVEPAEVLATVSSTLAPSGIDNTVSPFIQGEIAEINSLIDQQRFDEARTLLGETDKFIPDASISSELLKRIRNGETAAADVAQASPEAQTEAQTNAQEADASTNNASTEASAVNEPSSGQSTAVQPDPVAVSEPPRNSYIDATGPAADHLDQLRLALEAKDIEAVRALSQDLPEGRIRFLNSTFARHYRLDVIIDNVTTSGDTISGRLNVAMFGRADDGSVYGAGKWNGAIVEATRSNGEWQKIRW